MTIFQFAIKRSLRNKANLVYLTLFPIACVFLPAGAEWPFLMLPYGYQYFGILVLFISVRLALMILEDREMGVVKRLAVAPIGYFRYLSQNLLAFSLVLIAQCAIVVGGGVLYGQTLVQPALLLVLFISFSFTSLAIALTWITLYRNKEVAFLVNMSMVFLAAVIGGLMLPIEMFPELLRRIAVVLPTYWLAEGLKWIVAGERLMDFVLVNAVLWLYTIVFMTIGSVRKLR